MPHVHGYILYKQQIRQNALYQQIPIMIWGEGGGIKEKLQTQFRCYT